MTQALDAAVHEAAELLRRSQHAVAFTGAGISTPSGIPDFRSKNTGLWEKDNPMEVASIGVFQSNPERFYNWLRPLAELSWSAKPNPAHVGLAKLEAAGILKAVITQNIDNLHHRAGSQNIYEVHGSVRTITCLRCRETYPSDRFQQELRNGDKMPHCPTCGKVLKPDVVLFGEMLPYDTWLEAEQHCKQADVILVVGSSLEVWPAASLPELGLEHGARLIINNLTPTYLDSSAAVVLPLDVAKAIPQIVDLVL